LGVSKKGQGYLGRPILGWERGEKRRRSKKRKGGNGGVQAGNLIVKKLAVTSDDSRRGMGPWGGKGVQKSPLGFFS